MRLATGPMTALLGSASSVTALLGGAAGAFGVVAMVGWLVRLPALVEFGLGPRVIPFDAGLGLALGGFTWAWLSGGERAVWRGAAAVGAALMLLGLAVLAEIAFDVELGLDLPTLHGWLLHEPHQGRMAAPICVWFVLFGAFLMLFQARGHRAAALCLEPLAFLMLLVAIVGLISNWLSIEDLYRWRQSPRLSLPCAIGLGVLSASVWLGVRRDSRVQQLYATREEWMLTMLAGEILIMMAFVGGLAGFAALQHSLEDQLSASLSTNLANRAQGFENFILTGAQTNAVLASRAALVRPVTQLDAGPNPDAEATLESAARGFLLLGYKQIRYLGRDGRVLAAVGEDSGSDPGVPLSLPDDTRLAWDAHGFLLIQRIAMLRGSEPVGWLETAQYLAGLTAAYHDFKGLGSSADSKLCTKQAGALFCFPGRAGLEPSLHGLDEGAAGPMTAALDGHSGRARFVDEQREQVIAAYAPVGALGLGLLLKMDLRELYAPVRRELERVVPLLLILIAIGTVVLSSQVTPLASRLRRLATLDGLTGALNRATYMRMSEHELQVAQRRQQPVAIVMLDADHFKRVNDNFGHDVGDEVLKLLTATCRSALRAVDVVGRLGGEEFALTLPDTQPEGAELVCERLRARIAALELPTKKGALTFTVSIGVAFYPGDGTEIAPLLKAADEALYVAKHGGRNRVVLASARVPQVA